MNPKEWIDKFSLETKGLYYKLFVIFGMFFLAPVFGFLYFAVKHGILYDEQVPLFFLIMLIFFFFGFVMLRKIFDRIGSIANALKKKSPEALAGKDLNGDSHELGDIVRSIRSLENQLRGSMEHLQQKTADIATLKELSELCYITFNDEDLLAVTLDRALKLTEADVGSVMVLDRHHRDTFVIEASIGLGEFGQKGTTIPFDESVAKYAVINKSPLLVEDIETDNRFGRQSRSHYGTKSFICMPLKTMNEVLGVLTVSRRKSDQVFNQDDVDVLTPLLSTAAFTYDNLHLLKKNNIIRDHLRSIGAVASAAKSNIRSTELRQLILLELRRVLATDLIVLLGADQSMPEVLTVTDFNASFTIAVNPGDSYRHDGSVFEKVMRQRLPVFWKEITEVDHPIEKALFLLPTVRSCAITPLEFEGRLQGLLLLYNLSQEEWKKAADVIAIVGDVLVLALEKGRMLESASKRDQELETLRLIGSALSSATFDMERMLGYTMDMIRIVLNVEAGYLLLTENGELTFAAALGFDLERLKTIRLRPGEGIAGYVANRGITVTAPDVNRHPNFTPTVDGVTGFRTRSVLAVPMISQGKVIGVIEVLNKRDGCFNSEDEQLLVSIATSVCISLENARLYSETMALAERERGIRNVFQKFVPRQIVDKIILGAEAEGTVVAEFRTITFLNIDIRGFSAAAKKMGPQKTVAMLNGFFATMGEIVFKRGGIVDKYLGDGFLALFGAPVAGLADADQALSAALEMRQSLGDMNLDYTRQFGTELAVGISVHTGEAVLGNFGFEKKMDYTVIGDPVNFVFKLQSLCRTWPNEVLVSESTLRAAQADYPREEVGAFEIGPEAPQLKIYRLL